MQGYSGTYAFNGTDLTLQPTEGKWGGRKEYGIDGQGHPIYSSFRNFEMTFDLISTSDAKQLIDFYNAVANTGTCVACLPEWGSVDYKFKNYSGATLKEPEVGAYFQGFINSVTMTVLSIRT